MDREDVEEALRRKASICEMVIPIGQRAGGVEALAFGDPLEIASLAPKGEVDFGDLRAVELGAENGLHLGQGIAPGGKLPGCFASRNAVIESLLDVVRETSKFSIANSHNGGFRSEWTVFWCVSN